jgi:hypothetical protein
MLVWMLCGVALVLFGRHGMLLWPWIGASLWIGFVSLRRTFMGPSAPAG